MIKHMREKDMERNQKVTQKIHEIEEKSKVKVEKYWVKKRNRNFLDKKLIIQKSMEL